jgi:hypothetical protein
MITFSPKALIQDSIGRTVVQGVLGRTIVGLFQYYFIYEPMRQTIAEQKKVRLEEKLNRRWWW